MRGGQERKGEGGRGKEREGGGRRGKEEGEGRIGKDIGHTMRERRDMRDERTMRAQ
jgi:hypothetical protein